MKRQIFLFAALAFLLCACSAKPVKKNSWQQSSLSIQAMEGKSIRAIEVLNDSTVFFAANDGQIGYSSDSGRTWSSEIVEYKGKTPSFRATANNGQDIFLLSIENPALLFRMEGTEPKLLYTEEHPEVFYDAMLFFDEKSGIALGDPMGGCFSIILTEDGGDSWQKLACNTMPAAIPGEAAYAASNSNLAKQGDQVWFATGGSVSRVFYSSDRGRNWQVFETPVISGGKMTGIYSIDFYDEQIGMVMGGDWDKKANNQANKALTVDGGKTWKLAADGEGASYKSCVRFVPGGEGKKIVAVGTTGISLSEDGGNTWHTIHEEGFYTIRFANERLAYLAGENKIGMLKLP